MQAAIIDALSRPETYGVERVERHETHGSFVFLAGDLAFKLKKAVRFPYMDYSTLARRKAMCEAELAVNRRLAPELYVGVIPVVKDDDGRIRLGQMNEADGALDWLVVMRRFKRDALLEELRRQGELDAALMRDVARRVARFHQNAEAEPMFGGAAGIAAVIEECRDMLTSQLGKPFRSETVSRFCDEASNALCEVAPLLDARREQGYVRRCHGDLHLNNICLWDGHPVPFDAIEFNDDFSSIDVLYDLAFLLMDLDRHHLRSLANVVLNSYLDETGDYDGLRALPLFLACRAAVRAHVVVSMAPAEELLASETAGTAMHLLSRAIAYLAPVPARLVAVGGVSGTGKSTLAASIAPDLGRSPGAVVLRTDILRKRLAGVDTLTRLAPEHYTREASDRVYAELDACTRRVLLGGYAVVADAVFGRRAERVDIERAAGDVHVPFDGLWLTAEPSILEARIASRRKDASDATPEVLRKQLLRVEEPEDWRQIAAAGEPQDVAAEARRALGLP